jgi:hypothetical protein
LHLCITNYWLEIKMLHVIKHTSPEEALKDKPDEVLEKELKVLLTMSNGGGALSNDIINELDRRADVSESVIKNLIIDFLKTIEEFELENEACLQFELGFYLREKFDQSKYKIQLEKNIGKLNTTGKQFGKKEMDIFIFNQSQSEKYCIELKVVQQGAIPQRMYEAYKDVQFLERLKEEGFNNCYLLFATSEQSFWKDSTKEKDNSTGGKLYKSFRGQQDWVIFNSITKEDSPAFIKDGISLRQEYKSPWVNLQVKRDEKKKQWKCFILEI